MWSIVAVRGEINDDASYRATLIVKIAVVGVPVVTAFLHARARSTVGLAAFGALTGAVSALPALFLASCWQADLAGRTTVATLTVFFPQHWQVSF